MVAVIVLLNVFNHFLQKNSSSAHGSKFRNQQVIFGASFLGFLLVILGQPIDSATRGELKGLVGISFSAGIAKRKKSRG